MELSSFGNDLVAGATEPGIQQEFGATENLPCALHGRFQILPCTSKRSVSHLQRGRELPTTSGVCKKS
jgi:hypothetical protein